MAQPRFQLVPGARIVSSQGASGIGWRLLGANNRELGRSPGVFADAEEALEDVTRARRFAAEGAGHIVHDPGTGHWAWHLDGAGVVVAISGRGFRYERECRYNLEQFRDAAPTAPAAHRPVSSELSRQRTQEMPPPRRATQ